MLFGWLLLIISKVIDLPYTLPSPSKLPLVTLNTYVTWIVMCERYVAFVKDCGLEVLE